MAKHGSGKSSSSSSSSPSQGNHVHNSFQGLNDVVTKMFNDRVQLLLLYLSDSHLDSSHLENLIVRAQTAIANLAIKHAAYEVQRGHNDYGTDVLAYDGKGKKVESNHQHQDGDYNSLAFSLGQSVLIEETAMALNNLGPAKSEELKQSVEWFDRNSVDDEAKVRILNHQKKRTEGDFREWDDRVRSAKTEYIEAYYQALQAVKEASDYVKPPAIEPGKYLKRGNQQQLLSEGLRIEHPRLEAVRNRLTHNQTEYEVDAGAWRADLTKEIQDLFKSANAAGMEKKAILRAASSAVLEHLIKVQGGQVPPQDSQWLSKQIKFFEEKVKGVQVPGKSGDLVTDPVQGPSANSTVSMSSSSAADREAKVDVEGTEELADPPTLDLEDRDIAGIRPGIENRGESAGLPLAPAGESSSGEVRSSAELDGPGTLPVPSLARPPLPRPSDAPGSGSIFPPGTSSLREGTPQTVDEVLFIANQLAGANPTLNRVAGVLMQLANENDGFRSLANEALDQVNARRHSEAVKNAKDTLRQHADATAEMLDNAGDETRRNSILEERLEEAEELSQALILDARQFAAGSGGAAGPERSAFSSSSSSSSHEASEVHALPSDVMGIALLEAELRDRLQPNQQRDQTTSQASMETGLDSSSPSLLSRENNKLLADKADEQPEQVKSSLSPTVVPTGQSGSSLADSSVGTVQQSLRSSVAAARPRSLSNGNTVLDSLRSSPAAGRPRSHSDPSKLELPQTKGGPSRGSGQGH